MTADGRRPGQSGRPDAVDPLALAEAVAAGRLGFAAAEAALWEAHPDDQGRAANDVAELRDLVTAIRGVRRHADAVRRADVEVFDPDATSVPLGSARSLDDDRGIAPRRVQGGDVRLRPAARQRKRWTPVGALAAVAVLVVAVAVVVPGLLAPSIASTPLPSAVPSGLAVASPSASVAASPVSSPTAANVSPGPTAPPPTPSATGVKGVPAIPTEPLPGALGIAYWTLTSIGQVTVTEWRPDGGAPRFRFTVPTLHDPAIQNGETVDRRIVVSPDGTRMAFTETAGATARTRVFATDGSLLWTDPDPTITADMAWSSDGSRLVIGSQPATFKILTFGTTVAPKVVSRTYPGQAYRAMGFSASGAILYLWDTNGEAEYWESPLEIVLPDGKPTSITKFSGAPDPIVPANGTSPTSDLGIVDGWSNGSGAQPGVAPDSGLVLDRGGAVGTGAWELRDGLKAAPLALGGGDTPALAWGPGGSIVVARVASTGAALSVTQVAQADPSTAIGPDFSVPAGGYWRSFFGVRGLTALLGLGAERAKDFMYLGADELVAVDLKTGMSAVLVPTKPGSTGLHPAGWITAP